MADSTTGSDNPPREECSDDRGSDNPGTIAGELRRGEDHRRRHVGIARAIGDGRYAIAVRERAPEVRGKRESISIDLPRNVST